MSKADLATVKLASSNDAPTAFRLVVVEGADEPKEHVLDTAVDRSFLLGTSPACHVRLTDRAVSRRHAALEIEGNRLRVRDLGSSNGTTVNGVAISEAFLTGGELLRVGGSAMKVERALATGPAAAVPRPTQFGRMLGSSAPMQLSGNSINGTYLALEAGACSGDTGTFMVAR